MKMNMASSIRAAIRPLRRRRRTRRGSTSSSSSDSFGLTRPVDRVPKTNGPVWEPRVHHAPSEIEQEPSAEHSAMQSLVTQGCQSPRKHYNPAHQCRIPELRLQCMREIERWKKYRHVVEVMASKLPAELMLHILEYVASDTQPHIRLEHKRSLPMAARSIIGESRVTKKLQHLAEEAILNTSTVHLAVSFQGDRISKVAALGPFVPDLPHAIRHFELPLQFEIAFERQQYPAALYSATAAMGSLLSQMPRLRTLRLVLSISLSLYPGDPHRVGATTDILGISCRKGFSGTSTFKQGIADLLEAARAQENGPRVLFELRYEHPYKEVTPWEPGLDRYTIALGDRPVGDVIKEADSKYEW